jgi:hypothetical protein
MHSFEQLHEKLRAALQARYPAGDQAAGPYIEATFLDAVVFNIGPERYRIHYTVAADGEVTLGDREKVETLYATVGESVAFERSRDKTGAVWDVRVLKLGLSQNGWLWTRESAEALLPHITGAPIGVYAYQTGAQLHADGEALVQAGGPVVRNIVGDLQAPRLEADGLYAEAHIHEDAGWLRRKLLGLEARGVLQKVLGLSVDTLTGYVPVRVREGMARWIREIKRLLSVDIVTAPAADGRFIRATAGPLLTTGEREDHPMTRQELIALIKEHRPQLLEGRTMETLTDEDLKGLVREALKPPAEAAGEPEWAKRLKQDLAVRDTQARVTEALDATQLPAPVKEKIAKRFAGRAAEAAEIQSVVQEEVETLAKLSPTGDVRGFGQGRIEILAAPLDKVQAAMDRLFDVSPERFTRALESAPFNERTLTRVRESLAPNVEAHKDRGLDFQGSLRRAYAEITGDPEITGRIQRVSETITSATWGDILGNTLYRRLLQDYAQPRYNEGSIAEFGRAADFRTKEAIVQHYFGDLADVDPELADYVEIAAPGDDKVSYAVGQKGNILTITRKTIINDDLGAVSRLVGRLGRAARRTLARFIWSFWRTNAVYDVDALAWFHATHANTGATALTADLTGATEVLAKIIQLADMTEEGSAEKLGLPPIESLWLDVPHALYGVAMQINNSMEFGAGNVNPVFKHFGQAGERINVNPLFTDVTDWGLHVSPGAGGRPSVGVDFLQGREEPEFFLAEQPTVGQAFLGDKIQYKIRHEYGGDILGVKGATKNVVAG